MTKRIFLALFAAAGWSLDAGAEEPAAVHGGGDPGRDAPASAAADRDPAFRPRNGGDRRQIHEEEGDGR